MRRTIVAIVVLSALAGAPSAAGSVTLGQLHPGALNACNSGLDWHQPTVTSGNTYVAPVAGTITSWRTLNANGVLTMKMFRHVTGTIYSVVGHDGPEPVGNGDSGSFPASIPVKAGDVLGFQVEQVNTGCVFAAQGDNPFSRFGNMGDNTADTFTANSPNLRLQISAELVPTNTFTLGAVTRKKKKGTATISVDVPNPGELVAAGNGVAGTVTATGPGPVQLPIKAKGKKKRKLNRTGKVRVAPSITFTPPGGDPSTQATTLKLKKG
jgi:hypothetical protein